MRNGQNMDYVLISRCVVYLFVVAAHCRGQLIPLSQQSFKDITSNVFETQVEGVVAAFGDFDCDKKTDIFVIAEDGHRVDLWLWHEKSSTAPGSTPGTLRKCQNATIKIPNEVITSVVPGDYDGDSRMDLLVLTKPLTKAKDDTAPTSSHIYWGITKQLAFDLKNTTVSVDMFDQPLVMDYNADMVPDIFGADSNGDRFFWSADPNSKHNRNIVPKPFSDETETAQETLLPLRKPHSHIFVDLSGDLGADLLVTSVDSGVTKFEQWIKTNDKLQWDGTYIDLPSGNFAHVGQSVYTDIDASGKVDHLLPVCEDELCHNSAIYAMYDDETEWRLLLNGFTFGSMGWGFIPPADNPLTISNIPIMLNIGDYTMDGFPDALAILQNTSHGETTRQLILLHNILCESNDPDICSKDYRTFIVDIYPGVMDLEEPVVASFFDFYEDGVLDLLVTTMVDDKPMIHALENFLNEDACFVKVLVLSGLCFYNCPGEVEPYGVNQPGPMINYQTTDPDGKQRFSAAVQLSQSAYFSLQLPYVVMGLGQTPNFIDYLTVGIPNNGDSRQQTWTQIIPCSKVIVIPYPPDEPANWNSKIIVTPSPIVYMTAGVLAGTCIFIAGIVGILHWREKREDKEEKRQEAHRFHFDAM